MGERENKDTTNGLEAERSQALESIQGDVLSADVSGEIAEDAEAKLDYRAQHELLNLQIRYQKKKRREKWDNVLSYLVVGSFILSYLMIIMIGFGLMSFGNNAFAVPSVVAAGVVSTYGLAKLAIKYFFNDDDMNGAPK